MTTTPSTPSLTSAPAPQLPCGTEGGPRRITTLAAQGHPALRGATVRANQHPGRCAQCGHLVRTGDGGVERKRGQWVTFH